MDCAASHRPLVGLAKRGRLCRKFARWNGAAYLVVGCILRRVYVVCSVRPLEVGMTVHSPALEALVVLNVGDRHTSDKLERIAPRFASHWFNPA